MLHNSSKIEMLVLNLLRMQFEWVLSFIKSDFFFNIYGIDYMIFHLESINTE